MCFATIIRNNSKMEIKVVERQLIIHSILCKKSHDNFPPTSLLPRLCPWESLYFRNWNQRWLHWWHKSKFVKSIRKCFKRIWRWIIKINKRKFGYFLNRSRTWVRIWLFITLITFTHFYLFYFFFHMFQFSSIWLPDMEDLRHLFL